MYTPVRTISAAVPSCGWEGPSWEHCSGERSSSHLALPHAPRGNDEGGGGGILCQRKVCSTARCPPLLTHPNRKSYIRERERSRLISPRLVSTF